MAVGILLIFAGHPGGNPPGVGEGDLLYQRVTLPNGRMVDCMVYDGYNAGGVSCDWGQG